MATPVPPPCPRHLQLLRLLLSGLVLGAALRGAAAGRPDAAACPGSLDCALRRRARCPPGMHDCGPCLQPFQEDPQGLCVPRTRRPPERGPPQPRLEDEIDFLAQELARQEARRSGTSRQRLLEPATLGLSEQGLGPEVGLPSLPGASAASPRASLGSPVSSRPVQMSPLEPGGRRGYGLAVVLIAACSVAGAAALAVAALCWCRLQRQIRLAQKADYAAPQAPVSPAPPRISPADQRLAHSAEMYHYQHQRQQMLCLERHKEAPTELDSASSDEENEDGDFTVYECPGLAPTGRWRCGTPCLMTPRCRHPHCSEQAWCPPARGPAGGRARHVLCRERVLTALQAGAVQGGACPRLLPWCRAVLFPLAPLHLGSDPKLEGAGRP